MMSSPTSPTRPQQGEPFPSYYSSTKDTEQDELRAGPIRPSSASTASTPATPATRRRTGSLLQSFVESNPPLGMWQATGEVGSKIPTLPEIKNGSFAAEGWSHEGQMERRGTNPHEIHRRRIARTSSASTRTRKSSISAVGAPAVITEERVELFPKLGPGLVQQPIAEGVAADYPQDKAPSDSIDAEKHRDISESKEERSSMSSSAQHSSPQPPPTKVQSGPDETGTYPNGYRFPKKHTWGQSTSIGLKAFWKFVCTPFGFIITIYGLNVVGWGAMIFFVLLNAAPAMCHPSCEDDSSPRQIWIEIDSQVLNALFCVTAFGLFPWRARDFYYLMRWRIGKNQDFHRRLAGIYRGWYRLPGSDQLPEDLSPPPVYSKKNPPTGDSPPPYSEEEIVELEANPAIPLPATSMPQPPLTGIRAPPSKSWTIDFIVWMYMLNTIFQIFLCFFMWHYNRFNRPAWGVGLFISIGCVVAICAGVIAFMEGSKVKKVEGIPVQEYDELESPEDFQERKAKVEKKEVKKEAKKQAKEEKQERTAKGQDWFRRH